MEKQYYFLIATQVLYTRDGLERSRNFNVLITNEDDFITRAHLGRVQQQAQVRFFTEFDQDRKTEIKDVFLMSVNRLGHMTQNEFHAGFDQGGEQPVEASQDAPESVEADEGTTEPEEAEASPEAQEIN